MSLWRRTCQATYTPTFATGSKKIADWKLPVPQRILTPPSRSAGG